MSLKLDAGGNVLLLGDGQPMIACCCPPPIPTVPFLWLDAAVGVTKDGSNNVSAWADQSGNNRNCVNILGNPLFVASSINGQPGLRMTNGGMEGVDNLLIPDFTAFTIAAVCNSFTSPNYGWIFWGNSTVGGQGWNLSTGSGAKCYFWPVGVLGTVAFTPAFVLSTPYSSIVVHDDGAVPKSAFYLSAAGAGTDAQNVVHGTAPTPYRVGCAVGTPFHFDGDIAEVILWDRALTGAELIALNAYFAGRYGV